MKGTGQTCQPFFAAILLFFLLINSNVSVKTNKTFAVKIFEEVPLNNLFRQSFVGISLLMVFLFWRDLESDPELMFQQLKLVLSQPTSNLARPS